MIAIVGIGFTAIGKMLHVNELKSLDLTAVNFIREANKLECLSVRDCSIGS